jgi:hypothetical protein
VTERVEAVPPLTVSANVGVAVALPWRGMASGELASLLVTERVAVRAPAAFGVNATVKVQLAPGASVVAGQGFAIV